MKGDVFDYTKKRLGSKTANGLKVARCPACGKKGERRELTDSSCLYTHTVHDQGGNLLFTGDCLVRYDTLEVAE